MTESIAKIPTAKDGTLPGKRAAEAANGHGLEAVIVVGYHPDGELHVATVDGDLGHDQILGMLERAKLLVLAGELD